MKIQKLRSMLSDAELLAQLAEEASELSKAALKLRRVITGNNPTPVTKEIACENLNEEIADVILCLKSVDSYIDRYRITEIQEEKLSRWIRRLEGRNDSVGRRNEDGISL